MIIFRIIVIVVSILLLINFFYNLCFFSLTNANPANMSVGIAIPIQEEVPFFVYINKQKEGGS